MIQRLHNRKRTIGQGLLAGFVAFWMLLVTSPCVMAGPCDNLTASAAHGSHTLQSEQMTHDCSKPAKSGCHKADGNFSLDSNPAAATAAHYMPVVIQTLPLALYLPDQHRVIRKARLNPDIPRIPLNLLHANLLI
jgi:hypothetical protein